MSNGLCGVQQLLFGKSSRETRIPVHLHLIFSRSCRRKRWSNFQNASSSRLLKSLRINFIKPNVTTYFTIQHIMGYIKYKRKSIKITGTGKKLVRVQKLKYWYFTECIQNENNFMGIHTFRKVIFRKYKIWRRRFIHSKKKKKEKLCMLFPILLIPVLKFSNKEIP